MWNYVNALLTEWCTITHQSLTLCVLSWMAEERTATRAHTEPVFLSTFHRDLVFSSFDLVHSLSRNEVKL